MLRCLVIVLILSQCTCQQEMSASPVAGSTTIHVIDTNNAPIERCAVSVLPLRRAKISERGKIYMTDRKGQVTLVDSGMLFIRLNRIGYAPIQDTIAAAQSKRYVLHEAAVLAHEVVVTAQYAAQNAQQSMYKVQVVGSEQIEKSGSSNLRDVLQQSLGIRLSQDNILGASASVQGISGENVKILIDGVPVIGRQNGSVDLQQLPLHAIERVEIVEGPLSTVYGTNALAGAINLITKKASAEQLTAQLKSYWESVGPIGQINLSADLQSTVFETATALSLARNFFGGYANPDTSRWKQWKPREQLSGVLQLSRRIGTLDVRLRNSYDYDAITSRGTPRQPYNETAFDDYFVTRRVNSTLGIETDLDSAAHLSTTLAYSSYKRRKNSYFKNLVTLEQTLSANSGDQDTSFFSAILLRSILSQSKETSAIKYQIGLDANLEQGEGDRLLDNRQFIGDYALFASLQLVPHQTIHLQPALRAAYNTGYASPIIPAVNMKWQLGSDLVLRASYAHGFRAPSLKELYLFFVDINHNVQGNSDLRAESSKSVLGGIDLRTAIGGKVLKLELNGFYNAIRNMISLATVDSSLYTYVNIDQYATLGGNLKAQYLSTALTIDAGVAYTGRRSALSSTANNTRYLFSPELNTQINVQLWYTSNIRATLFAKYTGALPQMFLAADGVVREGLIGAYTMMDCSLHAMPFGEALKVSVGLKNFLNVQSIPSTVGASSEAHASSQGSLPTSWGRTAFIQLAYQLY